MSLRYNELALVSYFAGTWVSPRVNQIAAKFPDERQAIYKKIIKKLFDSLPTVGRQVEGMKKTSIRQDNYRRRERLMSRITQLKKDQLLYKTDSIDTVIKHLFERYLELETQKGELDGKKSTRS